jgi:hypothetical protein
MAQGNPFGRAGGRWMTAQKLRALFAAGLTYDEIAEANERAEGWKPSRAAVKRKYEAMGMPPRRTSHKDLLPWKERPEHNSSIFRYMLQAESRARKHQQLSDTDKKWIARLHELLFGRGKLMVVDYHPDIGYFLVEREDWDDDIIRRPRSDHYSDPGLRKPGEPGRETGPESAPQAPDLSEPDGDGSPGAAAPRKRSSAKR